MVRDVIFPRSVPFFEETLFGADPREDRLIMFATLGGDGGTTLRLVRQAQSRCRELTVIVPDQAKSSAMLFVSDSASLIGNHNSAPPPTG